MRTVHPVSPQGNRRRRAPAFRKCGKANDRADLRRRLERKRNRRKTLKTPQKEAPQPPSLIGNVCGIAGSVASC